MDTFHRRYLVGCVVVLSVLWLIGWWPLLTSGFRSSLKTPPQPLLADTRPNIVVLLADDLSFDHVAQVPSFEAALGPHVTFTQSYVSDPLCCPSRASLLLGKYTHNHNVQTVSNSPLGGWQAFRDNGYEASTIAVAVQAGGYSTALIGKYLNGYPQDTPQWVPQGWTVWKSFISNPYTYTDVTLNENGMTVTYPGRHEEAVVREKAVEVLQLIPKPFFVLIAPIAPHSPAVPENQYAGTHETAELSPKDSWSEVDVSDKPMWVRNLSPVSQPTRADMTALFRNQLDTVLSLRETLAAILSTVDTNTFVFVTSDNGLHLGEHRMPTGKRSPYVEDIRVPLWVRTPDERTNSVSALVTNVDLPCTIADLAEAYFTADCASYAPYLQGTEIQAQERNAVLVEHYSGYLGDVPTFYGAVFRHSTLGYWKYVQYSTQEEELYNLDTDPQELQSLHNDPGSAAIKQVVSGAAGVLSSCAGGNCWWSLPAVPPTPIFADSFETGDTSAWQ